MDLLSTRTPRQATLLLGLNVKDGLLAAVLEEVQPPWQEECAMRK